MLMIESFLLSLIHYKQMNKLGIFALNRIMNTTLFDNNFSKGIPVLLN